MLFSAFKLMQSGHAVFFSDKSVEKFFADGPALRVNVMFIRSCSVERSYLWTTFIPSEIPNPWENIVPHGDFQTQSWLKNPGVG
jgi:hypothetical protein